jgi:hypothetical protein
LRLTRRIGQASFLTQINCRHDLALWN